MFIEAFNLLPVKIITLAGFGDTRGFFSARWNRCRMAEARLECDFVQGNHSLSRTPGTVRELHFQAPPHARAKPVRCGRGHL